MSEKSYDLGEVPEHPFETRKQTVFPTIATQWNRPLVHFFGIIIGAAVLMAGSTWAIAYNLRIEPLKEEIERYQGISNQLDTIVALKVIVADLERIIYTQKTMMMDSLCLNIGEVSIPSTLNTSPERRRDLEIEISKLISRGDSLGSMNPQDDLTFSQFSLWRNDAKAVLSNFGGDLGDLYRKEFEQSTRLKFENYPRLPSTIASGLQVLKKARIVANTRLRP